MDYDANWIVGRFKRAQFILDTQVMLDMETRMPRQTGQFIQLTKARSASYAGQGLVYAGAPPFGHFLYVGKVMVDPVTGSPWARKGVQKVYTDRDLRFWYPGAVPHWFEVAKAEHVQDWVRLVGETIGGSV